MNFSKLKRVASPTPKGVGTSLSTKVTLTSLHLDIAAAAIHPDDPPPTITISFTFIVENNTYI